MKRSGNNGRRVYAEHGGPERRKSRSLLARHNNRDRNAAAARSLLLSLSLVGRKLCSLSIVVILTRVHTHARARARVRFALPEFFYFLVSSRARNRPRNDAGKGKLRQPQKDACSIIGYPLRNPGRRGNRLTFY